MDSVTCNSWAHQHKLSIHPLFRESLKVNDKRQPCRLVQSTVQLSASIQLPKAKVSNETNNRMHILYQKCTVQPYHAISLRQHDFLVCFGDVRLLVIVTSVLPLPRHLDCPGGGQGGGVLFVNFYTKSGQKLRI